jgi:hypothetical protein
MYCCADGRKEVTMTKQRRATEALQIMTRLRIEMPRKNERRGPHECIISWVSGARQCCRQGRPLRLVRGVLRHATLRGHRILRAALNVALVCKRLLGIHGYIGGHVVWRHMRVLRYSRSGGLRWQMCILRILRRIDLVLVVDTILATWGGFGRIKAGLCITSIITRAR